MWRGIQGKDSHQGSYPFDDRSMQGNGFNMPRKMLMCLRDCSKDQIQRWRWKTRILKNEGGNIKGSSIVNSTYPKERSSRMITNF